jgi:hypothetical protein
LALLVLVSRQSTKLKKHFISTKMSSGISSVEVTVETPGENPVIEVTYDGQEIIQPPLTLGEHFAKQAAKIDFETVMDEASSPV